MSTAEPTPVITSPMAQSSASTEPVAKAQKTNSVMLVPYPKFIFMYPTMIVAVLATIVLYFGGYSTVDPNQHSTPVVMTGLFLVVMMANMFVLIYDFPRATSLTLLFVLATISMALWLVAILKPGLLPSLEGIFSTVRPAANTTFFACISLAMIVMYAVVFITVRFDYWELRNNELLHHHGFLSDLKRYPAPNLRVDKEINDVFEFILLGAGRLILHPSTEKRAIVLDNVLFVGKKERELTRVLGSIKVQIGSDSGDSNS